MRCLVLGLLAFVLLSARAAPEPVRQLGAFQEYRLSNGLQLLLMPQAAHPSTLVTLSYRVGSRHEGPGEGGMAHLLEHVTFRGTQRFPDLAAEFQRLQVRFNGTTSKDRTNYQASMAPDPATLEQVLAIEAERMTAARLLEPDFLKEKPIVLNEMGLRTAPLNALLAQAAQRTLFRQHPYGRPVIGTAAEIEGLSLERLQAFYRRHYRPDNALLMIAGRFEPAAALAAVERHFGAIARPAAPLDTDAALPPEPAQAQPRRALLRGPHPGLALAYRVPGLAHPDAGALALLGALMLDASQAPGLLPSRDTPFSALPLAPLLPISREPYLLGVALSLPTLSAADEAGLRELAAIESRWVARLEDALLTGPGMAPRIGALARQLQTAVQRQLADPEAASRLLSDAFGAGDWRLPLRLAESLPATDLAALRRVAAQYLRAENRNLVRALPQAGAEMQVEDLPVGGFWARLFSRESQVDRVADPSQGLDAVQAVAPPAAATAPASASAPALASGPAEAQRQRLAAGRIRLVSQALPGARAVLLMELRWARPEDVADDPAMMALPSLLGAGGGQGAQRLMGAALRERLSQLGAELRFAGAPQWLQLQLSAPTDRLIPALELVVALMRDPALPEPALQLLRQQTLARLAQQRLHPATAAQEALREHVEAQLQPAPWERQRPLAELETTWRSQLSAALLRDSQRRWWSANEVRVAAAGGLPEGLPAALERLLGHWQRAELPAFEPPASRHRPVAGARFAGPAAAGESGRLVWQQWLPLRDEDPATPALALGLRVLAGDGSAPSGNRLADRFRGRDAISYQVGAQLVLPRPGLAGGDGNRARLLIQASGAPAQLPQLEAGFDEEFRRLRDEGPSAEELERVREQWLAVRRQQRASPLGLAAQLMLEEADRPAFSDGPLAQATGAEIEARLRAVTPAQVRDALQRLLHPDAWVLLAIGEPAPRAADPASEPR